MPWPWVRGYGGVRVWVQRAQTLRRWRTKEGDIGIGDQRARTPLAQPSPAGRAPCAVCRMLARHPLACAPSTVVLLIQRDHPVAVESVLVSPPRSSRPVSVDVTNRLVRMRLVAFSAACQRCRTWCPSARREGTMRAQCPRPFRTDSAISPLLWRMSPIYRVASDVPMSRSKPVSAVPDAVAP